MAKNSYIRSFIAGMLIINARTNNNIYTNKATFKNPNINPKILSICLIIGIDVIPFANSFNNKNTNIDPKNNVMKANTNHASDRISCDIESTIDTATVL